MNKKAQLRKHWKVFEKNRESLAQRHHGKYVIIYNEGIYGIEDSEIAAYKRALNDGLKRGDFYLRRCIFKHEEVPAIVRARVNAL